MSESNGGDRPLLVVADFVFSESGEQAFALHRERTLREVRGVEGCLLAEIWHREGRSVRFWTLWASDDAVADWVANAFHRSVLMPGFREWCVEGSFGEYRLQRDHPRARRCACGRWTQALPGWSERAPERCRQCDAELHPPAGVDDLPTEPA